MLYLIKKLCVVIALAFLAGCGSRVPSQQLRAIGPAQEASGTYRNHRDDFSTTWAENSLWHLLTNQKPTSTPAGDAIAYVRITQSEQQLKLTALDSNGQDMLTTTIPAHIRKGNIITLDPGMQIIWTCGPLLWGISEAKLGLNPQADRICIESVSSGLGLILIVPILGTGNRCYWEFMRQDPTITPSSTEPTDQTSQ